MIGQAQRPRRDPATRVPRNALASEHSDSLTRETFFSDTER